MAELTQQDIQLKRLRWQCRRGMKEMDILFERYLDHYFPEASTENQQAFLELVETQDPVVMDYITGRDTPQNPLISDILVKMQRPI